MRKGIFGKLSRKGSGKIPGKQYITIYIFILLVLVSLVLLMLSSSEFLSNTKNVGMSAFSGIRNGIYQVASFFSDTVLSISELAEVSEELERSSAEIYQENLRLKEQLDFAQTIRYKRIPAQISGKDPDNLYSAIVINKGSFSGVANDMIVVAWQSGIQALVGKVIQTGIFESLVMPIFDESSLVASRFSVSRHEGIVEGQGNSETPLLMRFVPKRAREEINAGDIIISSGMGGVFPEGINIGRVTGVNDLEYESTLEIEVNSMIDFSRLEYVFVIDTKTGIEND